MGRNKKRFRKLPRSVIDGGFAAISKHKQDWTDADDVNDLGPRATGDPLPDEQVPSHSSGSQREPKT